MIWGPLNDATIGINNVLPHWMIQQINIDNCFSNLIEGCCKIKWIIFFYQVATSCKVPSINIS